MIRKFFTSLFFLIFLFVFIVFVFLSTIGVETVQFNKVVKQQIENKFGGISIDIEKIFIKFDIQEFKVFLSTKNPSINLGNNKIKLKKINLYSNLSSTFSKKIEIDKIEVQSEKIKVKTIKKFAELIKPSTLKTLFINNVNSGEILTNFEFLLDTDNNIIDYSLEGFVNNFDVNLYNSEKLKKINFIYSLNKRELFIENINGTFDDNKIQNGDIKIQFKKGYTVESNIKTLINLKKGEISKFLKKGENYLNIDETFINGTLEHQIRFIVDKTLELKELDYDSSGTINKANIALLKKNNFLDFNNLTEVEIKNSEINFSYRNNDNFNTSVKGLYKINNNFLDFDININNSKKGLNTIFAIDFDEKVSLPFINYFKPKNKIAKIETNLNQKKDNLIINSIKYSEDKNKIDLSNVKIKSGKIFFFEKVKVITFLSNQRNNDFEIFWGKELNLKGKNFDARGILKKLGKNKNKSFLNFNKKINIKLDNISSNLDNDLKNFNLIGKIEKGELIEVISKGDFSTNQFLDISLKQDDNTKKKYLEIYSDIAEPFLKGNKQFKSIKNGNLLFNTVFDKNNSTSKILIEDFKISNAPIFAKLLSLADFRGMLDVLNGDGLSFDILEIKYSSNEQQIKLNEFYALGPSLSILIDGYIDRKTGLISLRGTMVPAKELNKLISKIPVVGRILVPKEIGEGIFGVSFKMKGLPNNVKTSVNPVKTLTPRFITKALEKMKKN